MSIEINVICDKCRRIIHDAGYSVGNARRNTSDNDHWTSKRVEEEIVDYCPNCAGKMK